MKFKWIIIILILFSFARNSFSNPYLLHPFIGNNQQQCDWEIMTTFMQLTLIPAVDETEIEPASGVGAHTGIDFRAAPGTLIWSVADGVVYEARYDDTNNYDNCLLVEHYTIYGTRYVLYGHLMYEDPAPWSEGQAISEGDLVGFVGDILWHSHNGYDHIHFDLADNWNHWNWTIMDANFINPISALEGITDNINPSTYEIQYPTDANEGEQVKFRFRADDAFINDFDDDDSFNNGGIYSASLYIYYPDNYEIVDQFTFDEFDLNESIKRYAPLWGEYGGHSQPNIRTSEPYWVSATNHNTWYYMYWGDEDPNNGDGAKPFEFIKIYMKDANGNNIIHTITPQDLNITPTTGIEDKISIINYPSTIEQEQTGNCSANFIDTMPLGNHITSNWDWSIIGFYTEEGDENLYREVLASGNTPGAIETNWSPIPHLPATNREWVRDENDYIMGSVSVDARDNDYVWHSDSKIIKIIDTPPNDPDLYYINLINNGKIAYNKYDIELSWTYPDYHPSDPASPTDIVKYKLYRKVQSSSWYLYEEIDFPSTYHYAPITYIDTDLLEYNYNHYYKVTTVDASGNESDYSEILSILVPNSGSGGGGGGSPRLKNYPNPFNPNTNIIFILPNDDKVNLNIYNSKGELVKILVDENMKAGYHTAHWDGKDNTGKIIPSGIYIYTLKTNEFTETKKMIMLK